jgi:hypothetical protein
MLLGNGRQTHSHGNDIQSVARQLPITTIEGLLEAVFSLGSTLRLYSEDPSLVEAGQLKGSL